MSRPLLHSLIALMFAACTSGTVLHSYKPVPVGGWERHDTVRFDLPRVEKDIDGILFIGLRTAAHVGIQDVVLAVEQRFESPSTFRLDTIRYPLSDAEGFALTPGVNHHQYEDLQMPIRLLKGQSGTVSIRHLMSHEAISGITEVGIRIDER